MTARAEMGDVIGEGPVLSWSSEDAQSSCNLMAQQFPEYRQHISKYVYTHIYIIYTYNISYI